MTVVRNDFSGGLNTTNNVDGISETQFAQGTNVEVDHSTRRLKSVSGTLDIFNSDEEIFYDDGLPLRWNFQAQRLVSQHDYLLKRTQVSLIPLSANLYSGQVLAGAVRVPFPIPARSIKIYQNNSPIYKTHAKICLSARRKFVYVSGEKIFDNPASIYGNEQKIFGIKPETIGAVANGGGMKTFYAGTEAAMSMIKASDLQTNDAYFATDTFRFYIWTGSSWQIFLSRNFGEMLNYEKYCVAKSEVDYFGADKILRLDAETGKANVDITGSPAKIFDKEIDFQELRDGHYIVYNAEKDKWVNLPNDELKKKDLTYTDEAEKIVAVGEDGKIHANLTGETDHIGKQQLEIKNLQDGDILVYHTSTGTYKNQAPNFVGSGKSLILYDGNKVLGDYNGGETTKIDIAEVIENSSTSYVNHLLRLIENLYLALNFANLDFGGYDALTTETFQGDPKFVKGEVIGIGNGAEQTVILQNTNKVCLHNFKIYFDGVETSDYVVNPDAAKVIFTVANDVVVTADYFYSWEYENFVEMEKTGIYPDKGNPDRATTQFLYHAASENILIVTTANAGETIKSSYNWKGKEFKIDSWAGIFNE